jgi:hypothetical protein
MLGARGTDALQTVAEWNMSSVSDGGKALER